MTLHHAGKRPEGEKREERKKKPYRAFFEHLEDKCRVITTDARRDCWRKDDVGYTGTEERKLIYKSVQHK